MKLKIVVPLFILLLFIDPLQVFSVYRRAPGISLFNRSGSLVTLSGINKNSNIILSFWATYCVPCRTEMPALVALEQKYSASKNVKLLMICIDRESDKESAMAMLDSMNIRSECLFDIYQMSAKKYIPDLKIPALFLIDRKGYITFKATDGREENIVRLEKAIQSLR